VLDAPTVLKLYAQLGQLLTRPQVPDAGAVLNPGYRPASGSPGARRVAAAGDGTVLRVVGRSLVAGFVSAALLAPPLWLLWELLPK
jgi:hypothetical protein